MSQPSNPNGANQYHLDPRQNLCWNYYINPKSETFSNLYKSAIKAGYEPDYAEQLSATQWFKDKVRRMNLLSKGEKVLEEMIDMDDIVDMPSEFGTQSIIIKKRDPALTRIKQDTAKFLAERLGKNEGYSSRSEVTGPDGTPFVPDTKTQNEIDEALERMKI